MKQLKLEYKEFESKRNLVGMYDVFLADERIIRLLPSQLGKHFFKRKRFAQLSMVLGFVLSLFTGHFFGNSRTLLCALLYLFGC